MKSKFIRKLSEAGSPQVNSLTNIQQNHYQSASLLEESFSNSEKTFIHPTAIVSSNVTLGKNIKIGPYCIILGNVSIDDNTIIYSHVSIGAPAQDTGTHKSLGKIEIGKNCNIREFVTIGASKYENGKTRIGNKCYIMSYSHIAHDVILEDNVILINNVNLGGHVYIEKNAFLMANSAAHQFCRIGQFCGLAAFSAINQDIPPFGTFFGLPAKFAGLNLVALKRGGFPKEDINTIKHLTKLFFQDKLLLDDIKKLAQKESNSWGSNNKVQDFIKFVENSNRGVSKKTIKDKT